MPNTQYTRCPQCSTAFKVTAQMLAMAKGKVRCGACLQVFQADQYILQPRAKTPVEVEPAAPAHVAEAIVPVKPLTETQAESSAATDLDSLEQTNRANEQAEPELGDIDNIEPQVDSFSSVPEQPDDAFAVLDEMQMSTLPVDAELDDLDSDLQDLTEPTVDEFDNGLDEDLDFAADELDNLMTDEPSLSETVTGDMREASSPQNQHQEPTFNSSSDELAEFDEQDLADATVPTESNEDFNFQLTDEDPIYGEQEELEFAAESELEHDLTESDFQDLPDESTEDDIDLLYATLADEKDLTDSLSTELTQTDPLISEMSDEGESTILSESALGESTFSESTDESNSASKDSDHFNAAPQNAPGTLRDNLKRQISDTEPDPLEEFEGRVAKSKTGLRNLVIGSSVVILLVVVMFNFWSNRQALAWDETWGGVTQTLCSALPCELQARRDVAKIRLRQRIVTPSESQEKMLDIKVLMVNEAAFAQPYPSITIKFSNSLGIQVAQKEFTVKDYFPEKQQQLMPASVEVHIAFTTELPHPDALGFEFIFH